MRLLYPKLFTKLSTMRKGLLFAILGLFMAHLVIAQSARVQVIHNSPTPGTETGPAVDIYLNGILLPPLTGVEFRQATAFLDAPIGISIDVGIAPAGSNSVDDTLASFALPPLADGEAYTVVAAGVLGDPNTPFNLFVNGGARETASDPTKVDFTVFHGSPDAPAVDVDARFVGTLLEDLAFGSFAPGYLSVDPALYYIDVRAAGSPDIVQTYAADLSGLQGGAATVFASGLLGDTPGFGLYAALPDGTVIALPASPVARLQVIHNSPEPTVDVYANGDLLIDNFAFRTATEFITVPAEVDIILDIAPETSTSADDAIASFTVNLENAKTYTVFAHGVVGDPVRPFTLAINDNAREQANAPDQVDINAFHGSPDAPAIDVDAKGAGNIIANLEYGTFSADYINLPADFYYLDLRPAGNPLVVTTIAADLTALAGQSATVFASGFLLSTPGFGVFAALADGTVVELPAVQLARVQVIHNSPEPVVDVYANGDLLIDDFEFRTATPFLDIPAEVDIELAVAPGNSTSANDAIATFPINLTAGETYTVMAAGVLGNPDAPFNLFINEGAVEASSDPDFVDFNVFHGSPDAPGVDVDARLIGTLIEGLEFGNFTNGYLSVPADLYFLDVRPAGLPLIVQTFAADLTQLGGGAATVFASGLLTGDPSFGVFAALPDGTVVEFPASPVARTQFIHNSPEPTVDVYINGDLAVDNFGFRTATPFLYLPAGVDLDVAVAPENSTSANDAIANFSVNFDNGKTYTVMAGGIVGDPDNPFTLYVNDAAREFASNPDLFEFNVAHGSPDAPAVDVVERFAGSLFENVAFGDFTDYIGVTPDLYFIDIKPAGSSDIVQTYLAPLGGLDGFAGTVFASGLLGGDPGFGLFVAFPDGQVGELPAQAIAIAQVVHNSPEPTVDVYINDDLPGVLDNFEFRTATPFLILPAETPLTVSVAPENSTSPASAIFSTAVTLDNGGQYMIMASGVVGDPTTPFDLFVNPTARLEGTSATDVDFNIFHGSPDAPAVDVVANGSSTLAEDLAFGQYSDYVSVPGQTYFIDILPAGSSDIVETYVADLTGLEGFAFNVMASGNLGGSPDFGLYVVFPSGAVIPLPTASLATAQIIHNSPEPTVDIYVNDILAADDLAFREATGYGELPAGEPIEIAIAPENSTSSADAIATFNVELEDGNTYTIIAGGVVGSPTTPFNLYVFDGARESAAATDQVDLNFFHGSPDAPGVDVLVQGGGTLVDDLTFGNYTGYTSVPADQYNLDLTPAADNSTILATVSAPLTDFQGQSLTVFASGFFLLGEPTIEFWVAQADGTTFPLEFVVANSDIDVRVSSMSLYPNPAVSSTTLDLTLSDEISASRLFITNSTGQIISTRELNGLQSGTTNIPLDISGAPAGQYFVTLLTDRGLVTKQLTIVR